MDFKYTNEVGCEVWIWQGNNVSIMQAFLEKSCKAYVLFWYPDKRYRGKGKKILAANKIDYSLRWFHNIIMIYHSDMFLEPHLKNSQAQASKGEKIQTFLDIKGH